MPGPYSRNYTFISLLYGLKMIISAKRRDTSYIILKHACFLWDNCQNSMNNQYNWPLPSETDTSDILLKHYYTYYITIVFIMTIKRIISLFFCRVWLEATIYVLKLSLCGWGLHLERQLCSRMNDDIILARPVKDTDLLLLGSAHPATREDCFWRQQSMARRVSN